MYTAWLRTLFANHAPPYPPPPASSSWNFAVYCSDKIDERARQNIQDPS